MTFASLLIPLITLIVGSGLDNLLTDLFWLVFCHLFQPTAHLEQNYLFSKVSRAFLTLKLSWNARDLDDELTVFTTVG